MPEVFKFCEIVFFKHFLARNDIKDDLLQEGFFGILELIRDNNYIKGTPALGFVYTKVRNQMSNFLNKKTPSNVQEDEDLRIQDEDHESYNSVLDKIFEYISGKFTSWNVDTTIGYYVMVYFQDKFGIQLQSVSIIDVEMEFIVRYEYYVNYLEYLIAKKFLEGGIFVNDMPEISKILEDEGDLSVAVKLLVETLDRDILIKILYVLSGNSFKFPSKRKLLRTDYYLKIYKSVKNGRFSVKEASKFFDKPIEAVSMIEKKYDKIYGR